MEATQGSLAIVILAAGQGTRMKSSRAKVLHELCGRPMLGHVLAASEALGAARRLVVVGRDADEVRERFAGRAEFVLQAEQRGTGHAVLQVEPKLRGFRGDVLLLYGDTPLLTGETLERMRAFKLESGAELVMLTAAGPIPGRVVRDAQGRVARVVEASDATPEELAIPERNTGVYLLEADLLWEALAHVEDDNEQGELYLTDVVGHAVERGRAVEALCLEDADECLGINTRAELAAATAVLRRRIAERLMAGGVTLVDPERTYVDADVEIGRDSVIEPGCVIQGECRLGERVHVKAHSVIESSRIDDDVTLGPSAHLRPGSELARGVRIGNFVEVKNSRLGEGVKADHLSYIGDADVGAGASFGCGSIVVNYDGIRKRRTTVGAGAFIGCNANLIAPVRLAPNCFVAAGSTISRDVPEEALALERGEQRHVEGWVARRRQRAAREKDGPAPADERPAGPQAGKKGRKAERSGRKG
jgi:bifunctional UDP-N-acetylglucosamine pyrophosphorylase/glucosamine-1-phosphate N-acetyltransferase